MPVQVCVDESGGSEAQGRFFVMAGVIAPAERMAFFSDEWQSCLDSKPSIKYFKMSEAANLRDEFDRKRFTAKQRDQKLIDLARIINKHIDYVLPVSIEVKAHAAIFSDWGMAKIMDKIYHWPFHNMIMASAFHIWETNERKEPFRIIFDEEVMHGPKSKMFYPVTRLALETDFPKLKPILPTDVGFEKDTNFLPLQASDLFAWCIRAGETDFYNQPFAWLAAELDHVQVSHRRYVMDEARLRKILLDTVAVVGSGEIDYQIFRDHLDLFNPPKSR